MIRKSFSLIIIPHSKESSKSFTISAKKVKILFWIFGFFFVAFVVFLIDYLSVNGIRKKYRILYDENIEQSATITQYKASVNKLEKTVEHFENYANKLNVMAGLESPNALKEVGIGGESFISDQEMNSGNTSQELTLNKIEALKQEADGIEKNLNTLLSFFEAESVRLAFTPSIAPTRGYISSAYGNRDDPFTGISSFHKGIDIATQRGNPVVATADGIVVSLSSDKIGGNTILISHMFGYQTVYCHLSKFLVKSGQKVKRGDVIGLVGKTGKAIGPHVHYEVRINDKNVNPFYFILEE